MVCTFVISLRLCPGRAKGHDNKSKSSPIIKLGEVLSVPFRLDYISCILTVVSTVLIGRKYWEGWVLAGINSAVVCVIGFQTAQLGFIPANLFCIVLYGFNLRS